MSLGDVLEGACRRKEQRRKAHTLRHQLLIHKKEEIEQAKTEVMSSTGLGGAGPGGALGACERCAGREGKAVWTMTENCPLHPTVRR